jgi:hypothetical protein
MKLCKLVNKSNLPNMQLDKGEPSCAQATAILKIGFPYVRFEVLGTVTMNSTFFWDVTPFRPVMSPATTWLFAWLILRY